MTQELLRLHDAKVKMDGRVILDVDDFVINQGERIVVLGPNGIGQVDAGQAAHQGDRAGMARDAAGALHGSARSHRRKPSFETVGLVSTDVQERMMVHRTVFDIVLGGFFGSVGVPFHIGASDEQVEQARKAIREIGIPSLSERDMLTLSTGQARRALIARALINGPALLIFDEPTSGLDPEGAWNMRQSLSALAKAGHTILVITHNVSDIMPEFDRVVMLQDAHIVADGPKEEVLTTQKLRHLFGVPITLVETDGRYHLQ